MKRFLLRIVLLSLSLLILLRLITYITDKGLAASEYENFKEWTAIASGKIDADLIVQGTSRAWWQYDTHLLDTILNTRSYNFGMDATAFNIQYIRYQLFMKNNPYPKMIIQNVDWDTMQKNRAIYQRYQLLPYTDDPLMKELLLLDSQFNNYDIYFPYLKYSGQLKAILMGCKSYFGFDHYQSGKYKGFEPVDKTWNDEAFEKRKKRGEKEWRVEEDIEKLFIDFLEDASRNGVQVLLVLAPPYQELKNYLTGYDDMCLYYQNLARKYNARFIDYSSSTIAKDKSNYCNATHLNTRGAAAFTTELATDLLLRQQ